MYDLVILNGKVFDGNDGVSKKLNIGITDDKIAVITELPVTGKKIIDASNKYVSPGFIDVHGHSDLVPLNKWQLRYWSCSLISQNSRTYKKIYE